MYPILKKHFENDGYKVSAEVRDCDVVLTDKNGDITVIELKVSLNITVVYQAMDRQKITNNVYIAVLKPKNSYNKSVSKMKKLLSAVNVGLILVDVPKKSMNVISNPETSKIKDNKNTKKIKQEIEGRTLELNVGGTTRTKRLTAYRDKCIKISCILQKYSVVNAKFLKDNFNIDKGYNIMRSNHHGYFINFGKGDFGLSLKGEEMLNNSEFLELVKLYQKEIDDFEQKERNKPL